MNKTRLIDRNTLRRILFIVCMSVCTFSLFAQGNVVVSGTVVDETGNVVSGVNIFVKGITTLGALSDAGGKYTVTVPDKESVLVFSFMGFVTQEIKVGGQTVINVTLTEDIQEIDEVVVVGYGTQKKVNLTGSVSTIKVEAIQNIPASNLSNALAGRFAGVFVSQNNGGRPGNASSISIRAKGSWNNVDPLYVIDGVMRDKFAFDGLDANDIESFSVLKDGASAAIYGVKAANGVILVTTKRGKTGKPLISYSGSVGISEATRIPQTQNAYEQVTFINDELRAEGINSSDSRYYGADEVDYYRNNSYDWMDVILQNPTVTRHSLNVTGGNERVRYFLGGSYYYESGLFKNTDYNRYNLRGSIDTNITKNLIASLNMNIDMRYDSKPFWKNDAGGDSLFDLFGLALLYSPSMYPAYINGLPVGNNMSGHVPELVDKMGYYHRRYSNYEANIALQYNVPFIEGLSLKVSYNNYSRHQFIKEFNRPYTLYEFKMTGSHYHIMTDEPTGNIISISGYGDWLNEKYISDRNYQLNGIINYDRRIGLHEINARVIYEQAEGFNDEFRAQTQYFISNAIDQLFAGSRDPKDFSIEGKGSETARMSYAGWFHYGYADRYMLEFSLRYDASLIFAPERRWGLFPSVSGAWRVSQEEFFKNNVKFISNLKLRGSVALLGNDAIGGWQWMNRYAFDNGALYGNITKGIKPGTVPNPFVTWEKSLSYDGGLEAGFLNNRLTMEFGAFYKHTYDILGSRTNILPSTFGGDMPSENYGVMDTRGFEAELGYTDMIGKDFTYRISGNMGYAVNKYIIKDEAENLPAYRSRIGQPTDRMRGYIYTDIIRTQADLDALPEGYTINGVAPRLGLLNYKDVRGVTSDEPDGKITDEDRDWIAEHTTPPLNYGFSVGASWKGIALDFFFQGVAGNYVLINERQVDARVARKNFSFWNDHYTPENINAAFPLVYTQGSSSYPISSFWIRNGAYLRLKNLNLSYTLPKSVLSKLGLGSLQVFFTGTNLWIIKDYVKYFDPEFSEDTYSYDDENDSGKHHNIKRYPIMRSFSLGINLSF